MAKKAVIIGILALSFIIFATSFMLYFILAEKITGVDWRGSDFKLTLGVEGQDFIVVENEKFRLTEVHLCCGDHYFVLTHELGDGKHTIPLKIPYEIGFPFSLEGVEFEVVGFDGSCGAKTIIFKLVS